MENLMTRKRFTHDSGIKDLLSERNVLPGIVDREAILTGRKQVIIRRFEPQKEKGIAEPRVLSRSRNPLRAGREISKGLGKLGLEAKPFCFHKSENGKKIFTVHGENFKWTMVKIADYSKPEKIPSEMFMKLAALRQYRVEYDGIWIAFPLKGNAGEIIEREMKAMAENVLAIAGCIFTLPFTAAAEILEACNKDPVLLVQFSNLYLELGRWE